MRIRLEQQLMEKKARQQSEKEAEDDYHRGMVQRVQQEEEI